MWRVTVFAYKAFKYIIYILLIMGFLIPTGIYQWCESQLTEVEKISPFDNAPPGR